MREGVVRLQSLSLPMLRPGCCSAGLVPQAGKQVKLLHLGANISPDVHGQTSPSLGAWAPKELMFLGLEQTPLTVSCFTSGALRACILQNQGAPGKSPGSQHLPACPMCFLSSRG